MSELESGGPSWYVHKDGESIGPFDATLLNAALKDGTFSLTDLWWDETSGEWRPLSDHAAIAKPVPHDVSHLAAIPQPATSVSAGAPSPPSMGPLGTGKGAGDLAAAWSAISALTPPVPVSASAPFVCEGCGGRFGLTQLHYARQAYLCGDCSRSGAGPRAQALAPTQNPLGHLLLKHAPAWALVLILVPLIGFKMLADMMDPYKSYPAVYPPLKQAAQILERDVELKPLPWAHAIRQTLLAVAYNSAVVALPQAGDGERDLAYIATLLALEGQGRDTEAADFVASHQDVEPMGRSEEEVRKFFFVEARILLRAGRMDLLGAKLARIAPAPPPEPGMGPAGMMRPQFTSPLLSGQKVYARELAAEIYESIACDDEIVRDLFKDVSPGLLSPAMSAPSGYGFDEGMQGGDESAWKRAEFTRLQDEGLKLVERIESWQASNGSRLARNTAIDEARLNRSVDAAIKPILAGARSVSTQMNSRSEGGFSIHLRFETSKPSDLAAIVRALTGPAFPHFVVLVEMNASRTSYRNQITWRPSFTFHVPLGAAAASTNARSRHATEFAPLTDTSSQALDARIPTARMLVEELRREAGTLERKLPEGVETGFGPPDRLIDLLLASSNSLTSVNASSRSLGIRGSESGGTAALEALKTRLAPLVADRGLTPESGSQRTTRENKEFSDWWLNYSARRP